MREDAFVSGSEAAAQEQLAKLRWVTRCGTCMGGDGKHYKGCTEPKPERRLVGPWEPVE